MKKLMIAAAIVCAAVYANASNVIWGFTSNAIECAPGSALDDGDGYMDGGTALLYLGTIEVKNNALTGLDSATYLELSSQQLPNYKYGSNGSKVASDALAKTDANQAFSLILIDANDFDAADLATYEGNILIYNGKSVEGVNPMDESDRWATMTTGTAFGASAWQTVAVPEPTSGLLLLLGVAGLALRRRRA